MVVIDAFLEQWKIKAIKYYLDLKIESKIEAKKEYEITVENLQKVRTFYWKDERKYSDEKISDLVLITDKQQQDKLKSEIRRSIYEAWKQQHSKSDLDIILREEDEIEKIIDREVESKKKTLIAKIEKKAGAIQDASNLRIGVDGNVNGYIVGSIAKVKVETIYAGGVNIQCLHYRILVK